VERLEVRDYCRIDWRLNSKGKPKLLEVNPNPGWCWDGHLAKMAGVQGMAYKEVLTAILQAAEQRMSLQVSSKTEENHRVGQVPCEPDIVAPESPPATPELAVLELNGNSV